MTNTEKTERLYALLDEIEAYDRTLGKLNFDMQCCAPEDGMEQAGKDMALVGMHITDITHGEEFTGLITQLHENSEGLAPVQKKLVETLWEDYEKEKNLSPEFLYKRDLASNDAYGKWLAAKKAGNWEIFKGALSENIKNTRFAVEARDRKYRTIYDACLDDNEKGGNERQLDAFFDALKKRIVPLVGKIQKEGKEIRSDFLSRPVSISKQEEFSRYLLELEGLKKSALVLMTTEHPFTTNFGREDVRVTTHYHEENFISNVFTTLHEGGHALFMQNEPDETVMNHMADRMTNGMHECISRFFENIIGRSEAFIEFIYPKLRELSGDTFSDVSARELYEAVNIAQPGLNRCEADELTYCLHVLIRYEMEKAFVNGEITVDEIPDVWNAKYREYLGVEVPNDTEGCLQDVHWSGWDYGYFPSYALGSAYGAQILRRMEKDFDVFEEVRKGSLIKVSRWLIDNVFSIASLSTPDEWIRTITGESLNTDYFLDYLEGKFTALYQLS